MPTRKETARKLNGKLKPSLRSLFNQYERVKKFKNFYARAEKRLKEGLEERFGNKKELSEGDLKLMKELRKNGGYTVEPFEFYVIVEVTTEMAKIGKAG